MSRPLKLTPKVQQRIVAAVAEGISLAGAASRAGIDRVTLWRWITADCNFCNAVVNAQTQAANRRITEQMQATAQGRLKFARDRFDQMEVAVSHFRAARAADELHVAIGVSRGTAWKIRDVLGLVTPPSRAQGLAVAASVLRQSTDIIDAYARGFCVPLADPRHPLAAFLGLETGRRWTAGAVRTGRHATKQALAEVRP